MELLKSLWWVPIASLWYMGYAWVSAQNNMYGGKWLYITLVVGCCPLWTFVIRYSKSPLFDGMLYDNIIFFSYTGVMIYLGYASSFNNIQWLGFGIVVLGYILMHNG